MYNLLQAIAAFQKDQPTTVFLLSMRAGSVGINLTAASHVFLLEPCINPALEEQVRLSGGLLGAGFPPFSSLHVSRQTFRICCAGGGGHSCNLARSPVLFKGCLQMCAHRLVACTNLCVLLSTAAAQYAC